MVEELPQLPEVQAQIDALALGIDAAELHGALCGLVAGSGDPPGRRDWLRRLALEAPDDAPAQGSPLDRLFVASLGQIDDPELRFALLLPDDAAGLDDRAHALLGWCRGFLAGFGLAGGRTASLSPESTEALEDLARIAASDVGFDDPDTDEVALTEIVEFVRVATLLLHGDCRDRQPPARLH